MTNMTTSDYLNAVDRAAGMNDRWLFIASLVAFGAKWVKRPDQVGLPATRLGRAGSIPKRQGPLLKMFGRRLDHPTACG